VIEPPSRASRTSRRRRRLHTPLQRKIGDHLTAEGSKEIGVRQAIRSFQLAMALLAVGKAPQGMGVWMGVMGRG
jgi:hypothetical protein